MHLSALFSFSLVALSSAAPFLGHHRKSSTTTFVSNQAEAENILQMGEYHSRRIEYYLRKYDNGHAEIDTPWVYIEDIQKGVDHFNEYNDLSHRFTNNIYDLHRIAKQGSTSVQENYRVNAWMPIQARAEAHRHVLRRAGEVQFMISADVFRREAREVEKQGEGAHWEQRLHKDLPKYINGQGIPSYVGEQVTRERMHWLGGTRVGQ